MGDQNHSVVSKTIVKCGEILFLSDEIFFLCHFCGSSYSESETVLNHVFTQHNELISSYTEKKYVKESLNNKISYENECVHYNDTENDNFSNDDSDNSVAKFIESNDKLENIIEEFLETKHQVQDYNINCKTIEYELVDNNEKDSDLKNENDTNSEENDMNNKEKENGLMLCLTCYAEFQVLNDFVKHKKNCSNPIISFFCKACGKTFVSFSLLKTHLKIHSKNTDFKDKILYPCRFCKKQLKCKSSLRVHERIHTQKGIFKCIPCNRIFSRLSLLKRHKWLIHNLSKPLFACEQCGKGFNLRKRLKEHMSTHSDERKFECEYCPKTFKRKSALYTHRLMHTQTKIYKCKLCDEEMYNYSKTYEHYKSHHNIKYSSAYDRGECDAVPFKKSGNNGSLRKSGYNRSRSTLKRPDTLMCIICNKEFKNYACVYNHCQQIHKIKYSYEWQLGLALAQPFEHKFVPRTCKICNKQFNTFKSTYHHYKTHLIKYSNAYERGECDGKMSELEMEKFKCKICNKQYYKQASIYSHMLKGHGIRFSEKINQPTEILF